MGLSDLMKCDHKLKDYRKVGDDKEIMKCEKCGKFFEFDYKNLKIRKIEIEE